MESLGRNLHEHPANEAVAELVEESLHALHGAPTTRPASSRRRDMVEAAKLLLNESLAAPPSLVELASALSCSPFHLSRIFLAATGLGMRHYLRRLRCRLAADRLRSGPLDLTELALDLGFYDHSHFTNAFRREWGVPPSRIGRRTPPLLLPESANRSPPNPSGSGRG